MVNRDRHEITIEILNRAVSGRKKTEIMREVGLSYLQAKLYLNELLERRLLEIDEKHNLKTTKKGLEFLASEEPLEGKTVVGSTLHQLSFYPQADLEQTGFFRFDSAQGLEPDVVVFRKSGYYYSAMRIDLSFERNRYTEYKDKIEAEQYDRVYSSPTFEVYLKGMVEQ